MIKIYQNKYLNKIKKRFNKQELRPVTSPIEIGGIKLEKNTNQATDQEIKLYQQQIGSLLYLSLKTRLDITFTVNICARFMSNPNNIYYKVLDRI